MLVFARTMQEDLIVLLYGICDKFIDICLNVEVRGLLQMAIDSRKITLILQQEMKEKD